MSTPTRAVRGTTDLDIVRAALEDDYEVMAELGRGGMAVVYEARERMLDRRVAIKVLPFALAHDEGFVERFQREARTAAQLEHPHVIPIYRVGRTEQVTYFVMKLLRGLSLADRLLEHGTLTPAETRRVLTETASALGYAHRHGVVHRDVKPENILLDDDGRCIVTDFGIARSGSDSTLTAAGTSMGTPRYMSPEQARALPVDGRSDIYSLGVLGYQCLTGRLPFDGADMMAIMLAHVTKPVPRPEGLTDEQAAVYAVIERMLAKAPADRFQTAEELIGVLDGAAVGASRRSTGAARDARISGESSRYGTLGDGPRSAAPLDRALEAGFEMLKQQRPKLEAGLAAGRRVVDKQSPRVRSLAGAAAARVAAALGSARDVVKAHPRRAIGIVAGAAILGIGVPTGVHFGVEHRSRCPVPSGGDGPPNSSARGTTRTFSLLLDQGRATRRNGDAEIYYDVCGLEKGTAYTARVTVAKRQSGLRRLLGDAVAPVTETYEATARGPGMRHHRSIDLGGMPAGGYSITVAVTDAQGRRRTRSTTFVVRGDDSEE